MAWTLFGFDFDLYTLLLPIAKAIGGGLCGFFLKRVWGYIVSDDKRCKIKTCKAFHQGVTRGLCNTCYKAAKRKVESGETNWMKLAQMGLCDYLESEKSEFDSAYNEAKYRLETE